MAACGSSAGAVSDAAVADASVADARPPDPFAGCSMRPCLHNCIPAARLVTLTDAGVVPNADVFCLEYTFVETAWMDDRTLQLRAERGSADGGIDLEGAIGDGVTVPYTQAGTWSVSGPAIESSPGACYRSAARIELANGHDSAWIFSPFTCF